MCRSTFEDPIDVNFIIMLLYSCTQLQEGLHFSAFHLNSAGITWSDSTTHSDKTQLMLNPPQAIALDKTCLGEGGNW